MGAGEQSGDPPLGGAALWACPSWYREEGQLWALKFWHRLVHHSPLQGPDRAASGWMCRQGPLEGLCANLSFLTSKRSPAASHSQPCPGHRGLHMAGGQATCFLACEWLPSPNCVPQPPESLMKGPPNGSQIPLGGSTPREDSSLSWPPQALWHCH